MESVLFFNDFMMVIRNLRAKLLPILTKNLNILEIIFRIIPSILVSATITISLPFYRTADLSE